jgi:hypothetical protein
MEFVVARSSGPLCNNRQSQIMTPPVKMTMMIIWKMAVSLFQLASDYGISNADGG